MNRAGGTDIDPPGQMGCWGQAAVVALFLTILFLATL